MTEKITPEHLARPAFVYIRQSTRDQVRHHHESRRRQYDLEAHARSLGWQEVIIIDDDLGKSGASTAGRVGFQRLVASVSLGEAGAVFSLEASRLARNNRDWHQLLELCGLMNTLLVDADGVSDPRQPNDRLLLGLKGTMSEAELGWLRQRAHAALMAKARRGELVLSVPVGYIRTPDQRIEKHPDQRVQDAVALVFGKFTELGSVRQLLLWLRHEHIELPASVPDGPWGQRVTWRLPVYNTLMHFLRNPSYAGAYAFGRTQVRTRSADCAWIKPSNANCSRCSGRARSTLRWTRTHVSMRRSSPGVGPSNSNCAKRGTRPPAANDSMTPSSLNIDWLPKRWNSDGTTHSAGCRMDRSRACSTDWVTEPAWETRGSKLAWPVCVTRMASHPSNRTQRLRTH